MLLISAGRAVSAMGANACSKQDGSSDTPLLDALRNLTPVIASAMNVESLERGAFVDRFVLPPGSYGPMKFRLSNGFLSGNVTATGLYLSGEVAAPILVDRTHGIVTIDFSSHDAVVELRYQSGFTIPDDAGPDDDVHAIPEYRVAQGVPEFLQSLVCTFLVQYMRNNRVTPSVTREYGFLPTLNTATKEHIHRLVYSTYHRSRAGVLWPASHEEDV